jgi:hypothetical protein
MSLKQKIYRGRKRSIFMKNTVKINFGDINVTIEGTPIQLSNVSLDYENEASVQELATSASFIKDLVSQIKGIVKEAQTAVQNNVCDQYSKIGTENVNPTPAPVVEGLKRANPTPAPVVEDHKKVKTDTLAMVWSNIISNIPSTFEKVGIGRYEYSCGQPKKNANKSEDQMTASLALTHDGIDVQIKYKDDSIWTVHKVGCDLNMELNEALFPEFINSLPCDEETRRFLDGVVDMRISK